MVVECMFDFIDCFFDNEWFLLECYVFMFMIFLFECFVVDLLDVVDFLCECIEVDLVQVLVSLICDCGFLCVVLDNLLINVLKYLFFGVLVWLWISGVGEVVIIGVIDEGFGILFFEYVSVFFKFVCGGVSCGIMGVGLGFYLVKCIVVCMGGEIELCSLMGIGVMFIVYLLVVGVVGGV